MFQLSRYDDQSYDQLPPMRGNNRKRGVILHKWYETIMRVMGIVEDEIKMRTMNGDTTDGDTSSLSITPNYRTG